VYFYIFDKLYILILILLSWRFPNIAAFHKLRYYCCTCTCIWDRENKLNELLGSSVVGLSVSVAKVGFEPQTTKSRATRNIYGHNKAMAELDMLIFDSHS